TRRTVDDNYRSEGCGVSSLGSVEPEPNFCECGLLISDTVTQCQLCLVEERGQFRALVDSLRGAAYDGPYEMRRLDSGDIAAERSRVQRRTQRKGDPRRAGDGKVPATLFGMRKGRRHG